MHRPRDLRSKGGKLPLTLIDGSSRANIARDLRVIAAAIHSRRPRFARLLQRAATQVADSYAAAQAVENYTDVPAWNTTHLEAAHLETALTEISLAEPDMPLN